MTGRPLLDNHPETGAFNKRLPLSFGLFAKISLSRKILSPGYELQQRETRIFNRRSRRPSSYQGLGNELFNNPRRKRPSALSPPQHPGPTARAPRDWIELPRTPPPTRAPKGRVPDLSRDRRWRPESQMALGSTVSRVGSPGTRLVKHSFLHGWRLLPLYGNPVPTSCNAGLIIPQIWHLHLS
ncbi:uncharacterized protein [Notamacropus eugenii]|uniref:uncharacterized protein isoform X2 n=1 Tax=Notamacropus eugenii TaxID=9315 RepID=UPI003B680340